MRHSALASKPAGRRAPRPCAASVVVRPLAPDDDAGHAAVVCHEFKRAAFDTTPRFRCAPRPRSGASIRPGPPPQASTVSPPQNLNRPLDVERLPPVDRLRSACPWSASRASCRSFGATSGLGELGVGAVLRDAAEVVEELILGIGAEVGARLVLVGEIGHQAREVVDAVVSDAHRARGEAAVAAALGLRRAFEHQHADAPLSRAASAAQKAALPAPTTTTS